MAVGDWSSQRGAHLATLNPAACRMQVSVLYTPQYRSEKQNLGVHFWIPLEVKKKNNNNKEKKGETVESGTDLIPDKGVRLARLQAPT